ncbi:hypothetical protein [Kitasatospora sp. GP82]|uniref:hypothetical protein n=1 Tax=Kitasatospora sp. GP82 TaxID=3035089 RepID=UPI0024735BEA|nr:hypothetical protein [Kitasatospora sp. GP82]MDH6125999.1 hypothetical protein [Kitasatospora sp. GP82]
MAGRRRTNPDSSSESGPGAKPEGLLPADYELADLYGAFAAHGREEDDMDDAVVLVPPVLLPPEEELAAAALAVPLIDHALKLARWAAPHRPVDEFGDLTGPDRAPAARLLGLAPAEGDAPEDAVVEAMRAWSLACDLELIEIGTTAEGEHVAVPGPDLDDAEQGDAETVLELWLTAAGIVRELAVEADSLTLEGEGEGEEKGESDEAGLAELEESRKAAEELLDEALQVLYETTAFAEPGQETVPLGVLAALLVVPEGEEPDEEMLGDITDLMVTLDPMLGDLAELGLLEHQPIDPELFEEETGEEPVAEGTEPLDEAEAARFGLVRLTALGQYGVRQWLLEDGFEAPLIGELAQGTAEELLRGISETDNVLPERELAAWLTGREPLAAARELLAAARGTDPYSPVRRLLCLSALEQLGTAARPAAQEVVDDAELGGAARAWLLEQGVEVAAPERPVVLWTMVDTFAAQLLTNEGELEEVQQLVAGLPVDDDPEGFFGELWRIEHPYTVEVLEAVGELHQDRGVAKEARKAAFKARSRRGK